jgi:hypothetical protein
MRLKKSPTTVVQCPKTMRFAMRAKLIVLLPVVALLGACATPKAPYDYTAFRQSRPASILVLPPVNETPDVNATIGVMSSTVLPLAEAGYYVMPVGLVDETFKQNGLTGPEDIQNVSTEKLRDIFGADAAVYIKVKKYGTSYFVVGSQTVVTVEGKIVDLRSGQVIWEGTSTASSAEEGGGNSGGLTGMLVKAIVSQIVGTVTDASFNYAAIANQRLLGAPVKNGVLYGPRSPSYQKD